MQGGQAVRCSYMPQTRAADRGQIARADRFRAEIMLLKQLLPVLPATAISCRIPAFDRMNSPCGETERGCA
jgi:hypothetical protein